MKKKNYLLPLLLLALIFVTTSCEETKEAGKYDNWRARHETFIDSLAGVFAAQTDATPESERLYTYQDQINDQLIYVKKHARKEGVESNESPKYTSTISAFYRMSYINGEVVQQNFTGTWPGVFDAPSEFSLNAVISGWAYTFPYMVVGDRWTLYVPYQSGYGTGRGPDNTLQPYSTLIYDVELNAIVQE